MDIRELKRLFTDELREKKKRVAMSHSLRGLI